MTRLFFCQDLLLPGKVRVCTPPLAESHGCPLWRIESPDSEEIALLYMRNNIISLKISNPKKRTKWAYLNSEVETYKCCVFPFSAQAELQLRLTLTAPLERRKGNTQHLLVSTSG